MRIHLRLHNIALCLEILDDVFLNGPAEEVELSYRRHEGVYSRETEHNALSATEGIEELLGIGLQLTLIAHIHHKLLAIQEITDCMPLRIIGHEPIDETETDDTGAIKKLHNLGDVLSSRIETLEAHYDEFLLTVDLTLTCL